MKTYTIENETSNVTLHASARDAKGVIDSEYFSTEAELARVATKWPAGRLIDLFNSLPGAVPVKRFTDRKIAVSRIWKALQSLEVVSGDALEEPESVPAAGGFSSPGIAAAVVEIYNHEPEPASLTSESATSKATTSPVRATAAPQTPRVAPKALAAKKKATRAGSTPAAGARRPEAASKTGAILTLMRSSGGTTLKAIMEATNWQAHSVRGFISGTLTKKMGLKVVSTKGGNGERTYRING